MDWSKVSPDPRAERNCSIARFDSAAVGGRRKARSKNRFTIFSAACGSLTVPPGPGNEDQIARAAVFGRCGFSRQRHFDHALGGGDITLH